MSDRNYEENCDKLDDGMDRNYENMKKKSTSGHTSHNKRDRKITLEYSEYIKRLKKMAIVTAVATGIAFTGLKGFQIGINGIIDSVAISALIMDFSDEVINPETHLTTDKVHYYYDYKDIANKMYEYGDFDEAVYFFYKYSDEKQTSRVLSNTQYGDFEGYLSAKGYDSIKDFKKDMKKRVLLSKEIKDKEQELRKMQEEHNGENIVEETTYGGKR